MLPRKPRYRAVLTDVRVIFEDEWLLVVDKPAGLPTQAARPSEKGSDNLYDRLSALHPYIGLHHRLDTPVSGLVLFTRDPRANAPIARAFREHLVTRHYLAVAAGEITAPTVWDRPIDRKPAQTLVTPRGIRGGLSALALEPKTGRTHQLRIHAALAGAPLVGDRQYGDESARNWPRLALHATTLALLHPLTRVRLELHSPLPEALRPIWERTIETEQEK